MVELLLIEEVVLLSLAGHRNAVRRAAELTSRAYPATPATVKGVRAGLSARGMVSPSGVLRKPVATEAADIPARTAKVVAIVNTPAPPIGRDAELLSLLALTGSLPFTRRGMHIAARLRIGEIDARSDVPPVVRVLLSEFGV